MATEIHPSAMVHPDANLGVDVKIGACSIVEAHVRIGDRTQVDPFVQIKAFTSMGAENHIHSNVCVGGEPQDLKFKGEETRLEIGDRNIVREFVTLHRGTGHGGGVTRIGSECLFMAYVHVAHDCTLGSRVILANAAMLGGHVEIGDNVIISAMTGIHQFVRIGEYAFIGAMSGIGQDVPPYMLATGVRAKLRGLNLIGLRRGGFSQETVSALKKSYMLLWRSGMERREALDEVERNFSGFPEVQKLVDFVRAGTRGITHVAAKNGENQE
ncbi:MAG: acyl-ACP--UDP-N-acetylglucosamine O-acyltransferase [Thermodesulfobacteriota bacterium]|nr:acyl-ACP--UDP-N-acetylglucosamine O-acyltransferase [Thermodesulfobacteriota bacterium]